MAMRAEAFLDDPVDIEAEISPEELDKLRAAIKESDAQIARGEVYSSEQVLAEMRAILTR
jgi:hypothetical protein